MYVSKYIRKYTYIHNTTYKQEIIYMGIFSSRIYINIINSTHNNSTAIKNYKFYSFLTQIIIEIR